MYFSKLDEVHLKWEGSYRSALLEMGHWVGWNTIENFARNQQSVHLTRLLYSRSEVRGRNPPRR